LPHIFGGDFNQQPNDASTLAMVGTPLPNVDAWEKAVTSGGSIEATATFDPSPDIDTPTRRTRLDYVFYTKDTPNLILEAAAIVDSGGLSDHRAVEARFAVK
jgi:endonuclease/exonuclease/phosphatase family metal-dependent hydrolase